MQPHDTRTSNNFRTVSLWTYVRPQTRNSKRGTARTARTPQTRQQVKHLASTSHQWVCYSRELKGPVWDTRGSIARWSLCCTLRKSWFRWRCTGTGRGRASQKRWGLVRVVGGRWLERGTGTAYLRKVHRSYRSKLRSCVGGLFSQSDREGIRISTHSHRWDRKDTRDRCKLRLRLRQIILCSSKKDFAWRLAISFLDWSNQSYNRCTGKVV